MGNTASRHKLCNYKHINLKRRYTLKFTKSFCTLTLTRAVQKDCLYVYIVLSPHPDPNLIPINNDIRERVQIKIVNETSPLKV